MHKFIKRPVIIDAFQWFPGVSFPEPAFDGLHEIALMDGPEGEVLLTDERNLVIKTLEGDMKASPGDWIIKGVSGEFYPCKPHIFEKTYDPAEASP